jgi:hypothetical protein
MASLSFALLNSDEGAALFYHVGFKSEWGKRIILSIITFEFEAANGNNFSAALPWEYSTKMKLNEGSNIYSHPTHPSNPSATQHQRLHPHPH